MQTIDLLTQAKSFVDTASVKAGEYGDLLASVQGFILEHFGQNGLYATYIVVAALGLFLLSLVARLTFSTLKYLVIPSVVLAFAGEHIDQRQFHQGGHTDGTPHIVGKN